jgi:CheY-like chemotaxis protein
MKSIKIHDAFRLFPLTSNLHNFWLFTVRGEIPPFSPTLHAGALRLTAEKSTYMTILLVDDDEDDRKLFIEATKEVDSTITCFSAADGVEALAYLRDDQNAAPDFVFLDLRMPGFSGEECLIEMKQEPRMANVPVIVYTTSRDVRESVRLKQLGAAHFASKPVSPEEVYYMVSFIIGERW